MAQSNFALNSLIGDYEQQYAIITAEITADIGRLSRSSTLPDEEKQKISSKITGCFSEVENLLEQIDLECQDLDQNTKTSLINRLNCYQAEFKRLKHEYTLAKNNKVSSGGGVGGGGGAVGGGSSDLDEMIGISEQQQQRLLNNSERIERSGNRLAEGYRTILETESIGVNVLQDLFTQRETMQRSRNRLQETNENLRLSSRLMNSMLMRSIRERALLYFVSFIFILVVSITIYLSLIKQ